jgi:hypothetical protein
MPKEQDHRGLLPADKEFSLWLRESGVTHVLSFAPLDNVAWDTVPLWSGIDPMLNSAWGRQEPVYLAKLNNAPGRASIFVDHSPAAQSFATVPAQPEANRSATQTESPKPAKLIVRDLDYPGWQVEVDGQPASVESEPPFRKVELPAGPHRVMWSYRPFSVSLGLAITLLTALLLAALAHVRFWHAERLEAVLSRLSKSRASD